MSPCKTGKIAFDDWKLAMKVRGRYSHEGRCSVYRCSFCGKWHIADYGWPKGFGSAIPKYALGNLPDAIKPAGAQRQRSMKKVNPFLAAAGLVQAPTGAAGRVYKQAMNVDEEEVAA